MIVARSLWKSIVLENKLMKKIINKESSKNKVHYIYNRAAHILPEFIDLKTSIHNGKTFIPLHIKEIHTGFKFGSFSYTRKLSVYKKSKQKKKFKK